MHQLKISLSTDDFSRSAVKKALAKLVLWDVSIRLILPQIELERQSRVSVFMPGTCWDTCQRLAICFYSGAYSIPSRVAIRVPRNCKVKIHDQVKHGHNTQPSISSSESSQESFFTERDFHMLLKQFEVHDFVKLRRRQIVWVEIVLAHRLNLYF